MWEEVRKLASIEKSSCLCSLAGQSCQNGQLKTNMEKQQENKKTGLAQMEQGLQVIRLQLQHACNLLGLALEIMQIPECSCQRLQHVSDACVCVCVCVRVRVCVCARMRGGGAVLPEVVERI